MEVFEVDWDYVIRIGGVGCSKKRLAPFFCFSVSFVIAAALAVDFPIAAAPTELNFID